MIRLICKKVDNDELPYHVRMIVNDNKEYYGLGKTIGGAINRIESLSGVNINHHVHEFDDMDICKDCELRNTVSCTVNGYNMEQKPDPIYENTAKAIGNLVAEKQLQYGNSFGNAGKILKVLYLLLTAIP